MVFTWIDWKAFGVAQDGEISETTKTSSPSSNIPFIFIRSMVFVMLASTSSDNSARIGVTPHCRFILIRVLLLSVKANMGELGRMRDKSDAIWPCFVYTKMASTPRLLAAEQVRWVKGCENRAI